MPATPAERNALLFLAAVLCLGAGVRAAGAVRREPPPAESRAALARQIDAVDSARRAARAGKSRARKGRQERGARGSGLDRPRDPSHAPPDAVERTSSGVQARREDSPGIAPAPSPEHRAPAGLAPRQSLAPQSPIDVDTASAATLERLPRIGPALARRIVDDRDRLGAFGSMNALQQRVRGIGPATARLLAGSVTFSGTRRP